MHANMPLSHGLNAPMHHACMLVYIREFVHVYMFLRKFLHMRGKNTCVFANASYKNVCISFCTYTHTHTQTHTHAEMVLPCMHMFMYIRVCMQYICVRFSGTCICANIFLTIHTNTRINKRFHYLCA